MNNSDNKDINKTKVFIGFSIAVAAILILIIIILATGIWEIFIPHEENVITRARVITPREANTFSAAEQGAFLNPDEGLNTKVPMTEGETVVAILNVQGFSDIPEEQFAVYKKSADSASPAYLTLFSFDENTRSYKRMWDEATAATRQETIIIYSQDLIGDRSNCIIVTGMNAQNEHTMTIFRPNPGQGPNEPYSKIAELQISGSIVILETGRSSAYQQGLTRGVSFNIASYGHDSASANILDQIEIIYAFSALSQKYEQINISRIPGSQIEQRRVRELLSGAPGVFENFIHDLWYFVSPQGTIDPTQYLYFDPARREIIFFGDEAQQVFRWQSSAPTRLGLNIRSQNISISTLLRLVDIELESLDSIRIRVNEDVRLRITAHTTWDGTYRRAGAANIQQTTSQVKPAIDAIYDSTWGRLQFNNSGEYSITSSINDGRNIQSNTRRGRYVFFNVNGTELLELRPSAGDDNRQIYRIDHTATSIILSRIRISTSGIQDLQEPPVTLTPVSN